MKFKDWCNNGNNLKNCVWVEVVKVKGVFEYFISKLKIRIYRKS